MEYFLDETFPFGTPYDECATPSDDDDGDLADEVASINRPSIQLASPQKPSIRFDDTLMQLGKRLSPVHIYQKIDGCYIRCDILDEKIFDAVVQLKDVHMYRSRYEANLIRARENQRSKSTYPFIRKKFKSARALDRSKSTDAIDRMASSNTNDVGEVSDPIGMGETSVANHVGEVAQALPSSVNTNDGVEETAVGKSVTAVSGRKRELPAATSTSESRTVLVERSDRAIDCTPSRNDGTELRAITSIERKVHPSMRSPMPKFIVTKVTEKEKSKETVKFDLRKELKVVRRSNLSRSFDSFKTAQQLMRKEISDAHMLVQMQRRKSLKIFNANEDTDASESDADALTTNAAESNHDNRGPRRWRFSGPPDANGRPTAKTIYTVQKVNASPSKTEKDGTRRIKTKVILHGSKTLESCGIPLTKKMVIEDQPMPKSPKKIAKRASKAVVTAETTDFDSEYEPSAVDQRRKSQRQRQRTKKVIAAAESEPELVSQTPKKQTKSRRSYVTDVTDFDTDTDGEAFFSAKRRRQPNKKYQTETNNETTKKKPPATPKKPRREYKPRQRKAPEEQNKSPAKSTRSRKSKADAIQSPATEIVATENLETGVVEEPNAPSVAPLSSISRFPPLENLPDLNSVPHKRSRVGKSKSDVSIKVRTQDMLYSMAARMMRRFSCYSGPIAPASLSQRVMSQSDSVFASARKTGPKRGRRKKRGRRPAKKKLPNFTMKLLESPDFSTLIDIARLNEVDRKARDDDDDSGSDVGDIEQQLSVIRRGQHLGPLQTVSSPLAHIKLLKAGRKPNETRKFPEKLITRLPLSQLKGMDLLLPIVNNEVSCTPSKKATDNVSISPNQKETSTSPTNDYDTITEPASNASGEQANEATESESKAKDDYCDIEVLNEPADMVVEHVYDDEDIESPAFEPLMTDPCNENFEEKVDFGAQQLSKTRVRTRRTRGRIRWSKPRKRPPIKYQPIEDPPVDFASSSPDHIAPPSPPERLIEAADINRLPPKILNSLPIQRVVAPSRRGRKRKMDNHNAPIVTVKSVTQKRGRYTRQETTKTLSLSIEPVNYV